LSTPHPFSQRSSALPVANSADKVEQSSSHPEPNTSDKLKKAWGVTWIGLETALRLLAKSADAFPPLKSAVSGLVACLDLAQAGHGCGFNTLSLV